MKTQAVIDYIVSWLADYCDRSGQNGFVAGVSGGVDSAVTSALCAQTGRTVYVLSMPIYQANDQQVRALRHMDWLTERFGNVYVRTVDLSPVFDGFRQVLAPGVQEDLVMANTRSRIRMTTLYAFAGRYKLLVAGTGNKVEDFGVGFFTKYGDGGVDLSPLAGLMKSEVRMLAGEMGILSEITDAVPTDGLFEDSRSDEEQLGASYDELEWAMQFVESGGNEDRLTGRQKEVLSLYHRLNRANRHKIEPIPVAQIPKDFLE